MANSKKAIATMKNIFKSLMLVAVAAMAFTACQKDNDELNNVKDQVVIEFNAGFDATRSGFGDKTGDGYPSFWDGNEAVYVEVLSNYGSGLTSADANATMAKKDDAGTQGFFSVTLNGKTYNDGTIYAVTPRASWSGSSGSYTANIPTEQTPRVNSVDPAAHILKAEYEYSGAISTGYNLTFEHAVAYGKMTLNLGGVVEFANIKSVLVNINEKTYTLNPSNLEAPTFWFACEEGAVETFKVTIVDNEDNSYIKVIDNVNAAKPLTFVNGEVSVFTVGGFEVDNTPYITNVSVASEKPLMFTLTTKLAEEIKIFVNTGMGAYNMLPEVAYDPENGDYGFTSDYYTNVNYGKGYNGEINVDYFEVGIAHAETGYHLDFYIGYTGYDEETGENLVIASYDGIVEGVNNPPMPETVAATEAPATINGSYSWQYNLDFEVSGYNVALKFSTDDETGLIAVGQYEVSGTTTLIEKDSWNFSLNDSTITVAHDGENYVLTFNLTDELGNTFNFTYTGQITTEVDDKLLHPGDVTPLATPVFSGDPVVAPTSVTLNWNAVDGAGSYELYYSYYDGEQIESDPVTTSETTYTFESLAMGTYYSFYLKAVPADENLNTESETTQTSATTTYDPETWVAATMVTLDTCEVATGNIATFTNTNGDSLVIPFNPALTAIEAGEYVNNYGYPQYYDDNSYDGNNIKANGSSIYTVFFFSLTGEGENLTLIIGCEKTDGTTYKATYEGAIVVPEVEAIEITEFIYEGRYYDITGKGSGGDYVYTVRGADFEYSLGFYWNIPNSDGTLPDGTYNYRYNAFDVMYSGWEGFIIESSETYYGSTLKVNGEEIILNITGVGTYKYTGTITSAQ